ERAKTLARAREFFRARGVLEVETPILCAAGAVDEHLDPIRVDSPSAGPVAPGPLLGLEGTARSVSMYLVTSPEHSMKRLLAAGSGPIYQFTHAFREGERGRLHNPEFTLLEWYRPGMDHLQLMEEVEDLIGSILAVPRGWERVTYEQAFQRV